MTAPAHLHHHLYNDNSITGNYIIVVIMHVFHLAILEVRMTFELKDMMMTKTYDYGSLTGV